MQVSTYIRKTLYMGEFKVLSRVRIHLTQRLTQMWHNAISIKAWIVMLLYSPF